MTRVLAFLVFFSILFFVSFDFSSATLDVSFSTSNEAFAQEELSIKEATMSSAPKKVDYELPYPGILPDNPLYFLKMIRDRIVGFLISDPLKKAEFDLLHADKRLNAGIYLLDKNKDKNASLAQSTISKGEDYFEQAVKNVRQAKERGLDTKDILRRLSPSSIKHQEILQSLGDKAAQDLKDDYMHLQNRVKDFESQVASLIAD